MGQEVEGPVEVPTRGDGGVGVLGGMRPGDLGDRAGGKERPTGEGDEGRAKGGERLAGDFEGRRADETPSDDAAIGEPGVAGGEGVGGIRPRPRPRPLIWSGEGAGGGGRDEDAEGMRPDISDVVGHGSKDVARSRIKRLVNGGSSKSSFSREGSRSI